VGLTLLAGAGLRSQSSYLCLSCSWDYVFSSTKLEKRAEQVLSGSEGVRGEGRGGRQGVKMVQTMYAYMNK
jgi:hypothetical protein